MQQLRKALQAHQDKDLDTAETIFKKILAVNPKESNALHLLGCIYKDRGQLKEAIDLIKASIRENDSNPIPYLNLGKILVEAGQHEDAAVIFQESLKRLWLQQQRPSALQQRQSAMLSESQCRRRQKLPCTHSGSQQK